MKSIKDVLAPVDDEVATFTSGLSLADYLAMPHLSCSPLSAPSMKHMRHAYETVQKTTDAMKIGAAADSLVFDALAPAVRAGRPIRDAIAEFDELYPVFGGTRRGAKWNEFSEEHGERYFRSDDERDAVIDMATAIITDPVAAPYWTEGVSQGTITTVEHGIRLKHRPDWIATGAIVDMKTTRDITRCDQTVRSFSYHQKMAMYRRAVNRQSGHQLPCVLIFVEQMPPHDVLVMPLDSAVLDKHEQSGLDTLKRLRECIDRDHWPGVANGQEVPYTPSFVEMDEAIQWADAEVVEV